jgi:hypothetical protein
MMYGNLILICEIVTIEMKARSKKKQKGKCPFKEGMCVCMCE